MRYFFSVIIPTLNEENFLPLLLTDLLHQTEQDFEIIVVGAQSQDKTKEIAISFTNRLPIKILDTDKHNVSYSKNYGAKKGKGDYLIFLDADSRLNSSFMSAIKKEVVTQKGLIFFPKIYPDDKSCLARTLFCLGNLLILISQYLGKPFSIPGSIITEKNFFNLIGGFNEKLFNAEDHAFVQVAYQWGVRAKIFSRVSVIYSLRRIRKDGWLKTFNKMFLATSHILTRGDIKKRIFEYEMGGQTYKEH